MNRLSIVGKFVSGILYAIAIAGCAAESSGGAENNQAKEPLAATCGGPTHTQCKAGEACDAPAGHCGEADVTGTCKTVGEGCTANYDPVCGCDGKTYSNDCVRRVAKVGLDHLGTCEKKDVMCIELWDPVCGKDGKTYSNDCFLDGAGAKLAYRGECGHPKTANGK